ncbi:uncharacterized protein BDR25DRAFT_369199 [Lindgomyces ingoldianus]|uniref:Uncharacterized protein n=1 Tax=Lindgomyces ingoldianus TaxID=673940 RepID=A0ACB6QXE8_9PLEO|nr:uncharacterized protein BDR25DRAFT_369199 [Lindgomyces ingoldianus]KAF2470752.1 hypothetical protein BDR25DRAFT_369199 [Lindgomyces ingoldianus]
MAAVLCGICNTEPKKYKCPTCAIPYCSLACFKIHKPTHPDISPSTPNPTLHPTPLVIPDPPPPPPVPKYIKQRKDFSQFASKPQYQELLRTHPTLLSSLQRIYAATIEPRPADNPPTSFQHPYNGRGRGSYSRGRGSRGRSRGGYMRSGDHRHGDENRSRKWSQKKGDADAMKLLKRLREGKEGGGEQAAIVEFVRLVEETFGDGERREDGQRIDVG